MSEVHQGVGVGRRGQDVGEWWRERAYVLLIPLPRKKELGRSFVHISRTVWGHTGQETLRVPLGWGRRWVLASARREQQSLAQLLHVGPVTVSLDAG